MLDGMQVKKLKIFNSESGSVLHALKNTDNGYKEFGEVYFSTVLKGSIKAWKLHQKMTLNIVVPAGRILFAFKDARKESSTYKEIFKIILSQENYCRITVPPFIWFGFKGLSKELNLLCDITDYRFDPKEILRKEIKEIDMDWSKE